MQVYSAPFIMETLAGYVSRRGVSAPVAAFACRLALAPDSAGPQQLELRANPHILTIITEAASELSPLPAHMVFKIRALFSTTRSMISAAHEHRLEQPQASSVSRWPGGRHYNDRMDFRTIEVVPSVEELDEMSPFLPMLDESDEFLVWEVWHLGTCATAL